MVYETKFWKKSWDAHVKELDPKEWDRPFADALRDTFENLPNKQDFTCQSRCSQSADKDHPAPVSGPICQPSR